MNEKKGCSSDAAYQIYSPKLLLFENGSKGSLLSQVCSAL